MYDNNCKDCENLRHCKPMMNMPMMNPMMNMPMMNPMMNMPMYEMPEFDENDDDLKNLYPKIYIRIYPMVKYHCHMMVSRYGTMYCPSKEEMDHVCKEICDMYEKHYKDDDDDDDNDRNYDDDGMRQRHRRGSIRDLIRILFIRDLFGRRRRRRRRRRRHYRDDD